MNVQKYSMGLLKWRPPFSHKSFSAATIKEKTLHNLCKYLSIPENKANLLCMKHPAINKLNEEKIRSVVETFHQLGYPGEVLCENPTLFSALPVTLRFRYSVLKECGISQIEPSHLVSYLKIVKQKTVGELKKSGEISTRMNLENRLASYMTQWPTSLTTLIDEDIDSSTLYMLRLKIIQRYLELLLDLSQEEFHRGIQTYPTIKHRPLEVINETLKILQSVMMIPDHKIKSNLYLIHADPKNLKDIMYNLRSIGGIDVKEVIRLHPKIALKNCSALIEIRNILKEYRISSEAQIRCFDIYTLGPNTVRERLERAMNTPEFRAFVNHPRFLKMIYYSTTAIKRLNSLYSQNKKCLSLNILSGSSAHFETFEKAPGDRLGKGKDLIFCISQSLGTKYNMTTVRNILKQHPFWINIPLVHVKLVYQKLSSEFSANDIYENCSILLYPWSKIKETLYILNKNNLHSCYPFIHESIDIDKLNKSQKLSLVHYLVEKKHYFTGNGVWSEEKVKSIDVPQLTQSNQ